MCVGGDRGRTLFGRVTRVSDSFPILGLGWRGWDFWLRRDFEGTPRLDVVKVTEGSFSTDGFVAEVAVLGGVNG